jgi:diaminopimelate decarboxylase
MMFQYRNGNLHWFDYNLERLSRDYSSPLHVIHARAVRTSVEQFLAPFQKENLPIACHFSVKTNPVPELLLLLRQCGVGVEIVNEHELWLVRKLGFRGKEIIVNGPGKSQGLFSAGLDCGVKMLSAESITDIDRLESLNIKNGKLLNIGIRICPALSFKRLDPRLHSAIKESPYGFLPDSRDLEEALKKIHSNSHMRFAGFHVHLGSGISNSRPYIKALAILENEILHADRLGCASRMINIGGGFGSETAPVLSALQFIAGLVHTRVRRSVNQEHHQLLGLLAGELSRMLANLHRQGLTIEQIIAEPGRRLTGSAQITLLTVLDVIHRRRDRRILICDGGAMSLSPMLLTEHHRLLPTVLHGGPKHVYTVLGNLPSQLDLVSHAAELPEMHKGDRLAVLDTGAYFIPFANNFNGPRPAIVLIDGDHARLSRKAEDRQDLIRHDVYVKFKK